MENQNPKQRKWIHKVHNQFLVDKKLYCLIIIFIYKNNLFIMSWEWWITWKIMRDLFANDYGESCLSSEFIKWIQINFVEYNEDLENLFLNNPEQSQLIFEWDQISKEWLVDFKDSIDFEELLRKSHLSVWVMLDISQWLNTKILTKLLYDKDFMIIFLSLKQLKEKIPKLYNNFNSFSKKTLNIIDILKTFISNLLSQRKDNKELIINDWIQIDDYYKGEIERLDLEIDNYLMIQEKLFLYLLEKIAEKLNINKKELIQK